MKFAESEVKQPAITTTVEGNTRVYLSFPICREDGTVISSIDLPPFFKLHQLESVVIKVMSGQSVGIDLISEVLELVSGVKAVYYRQLSLIDCGVFVGLINARIRSFADGIALGESFEPPKPEDLQKGESP